MEGDPLFVSATITVLGPYKDALFILLLPEQLLASLRVKSAAVVVHPRLGGGLEPLQRKALLRHTLAHLRVRLEVHVEQVQHELLHQGGLRARQRPLHGVQLFQHRLEAGHEVDLSGPPASVPSVPPAPTPAPPSPPRFYIYKLPIDRPSGCYVTN